MKDRHAITPYPIRMPPELRTQLEEAAKEGNRSLHAEIIARLQASFEPSIAESEFHATSKVTHTHIDNDLLEEAAERGAEKAIRGIILLADEAHKSEASPDYLTYALRMIKGQDKDGNPIQHNRPRTPLIPGANAPKRGLGSAPKPAKAPKPPKQEIVKKRVLFDAPTDSSEE